LNKFTLYESKTRFFIVASNNADTRHRLLQIDRTTVPQDELRLIDDGAVLSAKEMNAALKSLDEKNRAGGGIGKSRVIFGIAGNEGPLHVAFAQMADECIRVY
jgi:hypothetical protein